MMLSGAPVQGLHESTRIIGIDPSFTSCGVSDGTNHITIATHSREVEASSESINRRCSEICKAIAEFIDNRDVVLFVEAPAFGQARGASHLYELGWLMHDLHCLLPTQTYGDVLSVNEVNPATLRKWATGKGNAPKDEMKLRAFKKFGVEFERDPGCDKLFAFLLVKYGDAVISGKIVHSESPPRGKKRRAT